MAPTTTGSAFATLLALQEVWPDFAEDLQPNHCILVTRVAIEVGRYFGVDYEAMPVTIAVFNEAGWRLFREGVPNKDWPEEAWSVGTFCEDTFSDRSWNGHLIVSGPGVLADLNATQMSRPHRGIDLPNWISPTPDGEPPWTWSKDDGTHITIKPEQARHYRQSRDWRINYKSLTSEVIRLIKPMMGEN